MRLAVSDADRHAAARLRYDVYVQELGKPYPEADHAKGLLTDELDNEAIIVVVLDGSDVAGTVRANWLPSDIVRSRYGSLFDFERFNRCAPSSISVCSRLAVSPQLRDRSARGLLLETVYAVGLSRGTALCFATCAPPILKIFLHYGSREYASPIVDSAAGVLHRTVLVLDDLEHLERIRSPLLAIARQREVQPERRPWLDALFDQYRDRHATA